MDVGPYDFYSDPAYATGNGSAIVPDGKRAADAELPSPGKTKQSKTDPKVVAKVWKAFDDGEWYCGSTNRYGVQDGRGCQVLGTGVFEGDFKKGARHGDGKLTIRNGATLRATFADEHVEGGGTYIDDKGTEFSCEVLNELGDRHLVVISNHERTWLADGYTLRPIEGDGLQFLEPEVPRIFAATIRRGHLDLAISLLPFPERTKFDGPTEDALWFKRLKEAIVIETGDDSPEVAGGKREADTQLESTERSKRNRTLPRVISKVWQAFGDNDWYRGSTKNGVPHGRGCWVTENYVLEGHFKNGVEHGEGKLTMKTGATLQALFRNHGVKGIGTYIDDRGVRFSCEALNEFDRHRPLLISNHERAWLAEWNKDRELQMIADGELAFLEPDNSVTAEPYRFRPNTRIIELRNDPANPNADLLNRIGFIFHELDLSRLAASAREVQQRVLVGLMARHFSASEDGDLGPVSVDMPGNTEGANRWFLMVAQDTGDIAAATFARVGCAEAELTSVTVAPYLRSSGLGSLFLCLSVRQLESAHKVNKISLCAAARAMNWYHRHGFSSAASGTKSDDDTRLLLDLNSSVQVQEFSAAEHQLVPLLFTKAMCSGDLDRAMGLLPILKQGVYFDGAIGEGLWINLIDYAVKRNNGDLVGQTLHRLATQEAQTSAIAANVMSIVEVRCELAYIK